MADKKIDHKYKKLHAEITLVGTGGAPAVRHTVEGGRACEYTMAEIPDYLATLAKEVIMRNTDAKVGDLTARFDDAVKHIQKLEGEIDNLNKKLASQ